MWNLTTRRRSDEPMEDCLVEPTPLSRFAPRHQRELPQQRDETITPQVVDSPVFLPRDAPETPLNQMLYAKTPLPTSVKPKPAAKPQYLTGLEEEAPISISVLQRALPNRFED